jgi:hypothetical protein
VIEKYARFFSPPIQAVRFPASRERDLQNERVSEEKTTGERQALQINWDMFCGPLLLLSPHLSNEAPKAAKYLIPLRVVHTPPSRGSLFSDNDLLYWKENVEVKPVR